MRSENSRRLSAREVCAQESENWNNFARSNAGWAGKPPQSRSILLLVPAMPRKAHPQFRSNLDIDLSPVFANRDLPRRPSLDGRTTARFEFQKSRCQIRSLRVPICEHTPPGI